MPDVTFVAQGPQISTPPIDGTFTLPSGDYSGPGTVQAGDLLIAFIHIKAGFVPAPPTMPTGWNRIGGDSANILQLFYKWAVAGEPTGTLSAYTFTNCCAGSSGSGVGEASIMTFRGVDRTTPIEPGSFAAQSGQTSSTIFPFSALALPKRGRGIFASCYIRNGSASTINSGLPSDVSYFGASTGVSSTNSYGGRMSYGDTLQGSLGSQNVAAGITINEWATAVLALRAAVNRQGVM